jgi:hypothetical protein
MALSVQQHPGDCDELDVSWTKYKMSTEAKCRGLLEEGHLIKGEGETNANVICFEN